MPNKDRGMIKWAPFDSVTSGKKLVRDILKEKSAISCPVLSSEQKINLEKKLLLAYYTKNQITIEYYYNGHIYAFKTCIKKIDSAGHKIYFNNKILFFDQIINIS